MDWNWKCAPTCSISKEFLRKILKTHTVSGFISQIDSLAASVWDCAAESFLPGIAMIVIGLWIWGWKCQLRTICTVRTNCDCVNFVALRNYAVGGSVNCGDTPSCPRRVTRPAESKPNLGTAGWPPATLDSQTQSTPRPLKHFQSIYNGPQAHNYICLFYRHRSLYAPTLEGPEYSSASGWLRLTTTCSSCYSSGTRGLGKPASSSDSLRTPLMLPLSPQ